MNRTNYIYITFLTFPLLAKLSNTILYDAFPITFDVIPTPYVVHPEILFEQTAYGLTITTKFVGQNIFLK